MRVLRKVLSRLLLTMMVLPLLFTGSAAAEGMAYREIPVKMTVQVDGFNQGIVDMGIALQPGEVFRVELLSASGTGYLWQVEGEPTLVSTSQTADPQPLYSCPSLGR